MRHPISARAWRDGVGNTQRGKMGKLIGGLTGTMAVAFYVGTFIGWAWWMWMAIHFGSFWMFVFGLAGPTGIFAGLLGLWSLLFGIPTWLLHLVT